MPLPKCGGISGVVGLIAEADFLQTLIRFGWAQMKIYLLGKQEIIEHSKILGIIYR